MVLTVAVRTTLATTTRIMKPLLLSLILTTTAFADDLPQWRDLFNGRDLTGRCYA